MAKKSAKPTKAAAQKKQTKPAPKQQSKPKTTQPKQSKPTPKVKDTKPAKSAAAQKPAQSAKPASKKHDELPPTVGKQRAQDSYDITVFVPTYFGEKYLDDLFKMVFRQKIDKAVEVLVYDTSSKDKTPQIITKYAEQHPNLRWKTITKEEYGHGKTRAAASHDAKGDIVVYLSQDAVPAHNRWLYEMTKPFELSPRIIGVVGKQDPRPKTFPLLKREITSVFRSFGPDEGTTLFYADDFVKNQEIYDKISFYSDANSAARRDYLTGELPYKDVPYAEDQLFGRDIINAGYMKAYASRGNVQHSNDFTLFEYKHRMFDETMGLRKVGIKVAVPGKRFIIRAVIGGVIRDIFWTLRDGHYGWKRKIWGVVTAPLYNIEKWRGVRAAALADVDDDVANAARSLEGRQAIKNKHK